VISRIRDVIPAIIDPNPKSTTAPEAVFVGKISDDATYCDNARSKHTKYLKQKDVSPMLPDGNAEFIQLKLFVL